MVKKYLYYFIKKSSERTHRAYYREYYKEYVARFEASADRKPASVIRREMKALKKYWGCEPIQYYRYAFWHRDCQLTLGQMKGYVPDFFAYYLLFPLSFRDRNVLCEDKRLMYSLNKGLGIPQPHILFTTQNGEFFDENRTPVTAHQALRACEESSAKRLFAKPTYGVGGKGICVFERDGAGYRDCKDHELLTEKHLMEFSKDDYIAQEGLVQHPVMNAVYPGAINTFRMVTECDGEGHAHVLLALLRMGSGGGYIDNASSGGLYIRIDPQTGELGNKALRDDRSEYETHPDTGFRFGGYQPPMWEELKAFACATALKYCELRYVGWDVAYTTDGPVIIEGNNGPSIEILQDHYGGLRDIFGIDDPKKYWFQENFNIKNC